MLAITFKNLGLHLQQELVVKRLRISEAKRLLFEGWVWGNLN